MFSPKLNSEGMWSQSFKKDLFYWVGNRTPELNKEQSECSWTLNALKSPMGTLTWSFSFFQLSLISWKLLHIYADHLNLSKDSKLRSTFHDLSPTVHLVVLADPGRSVHCCSMWFIFISSKPKEFFLLFHLQKKPRKRKNKICAELTFSCFHPSNFVLHYLILVKWMKCLTTLYGLIVKNEKYHISYRDAAMGESSRRVEESDISTPCWDI